MERLGVALGLEEGSIDKDGVALGFDEGSTEILGVALGPEDGSRESNTKANTCHIIKVTIKAF